MPDKIFNIQGQVINFRTKEYIPNVVIEVWNKDIRQHTLLIREKTDSEGRFEARFDETFFVDFNLEKLPEIYFKIFQGDDLIYSTEGKPIKNVPVGRSSFVISIDPVMPKNPKTEVAIHELGESIAVSLARMQQELARYPNNLGSFILDEMNLELPVSLRVDNLGQVMATVTDNQEPDVLIGKLQLKVRPVLGVHEPPPVISDQSIGDIGVFSDETIENLHQQRIFSVDDLLRVSRNASGRSVLSKLNLGANLDEVIDRARVLSLPNIPPSVRAHLIKIGIKSPQDFVKFSSTKLAKALSASHNEKISSKDIQSWQREVKKYIKLPLPSLRHGIDRPVPIKTISSSDEEDKE